MNIFNIPAKLPEKEILEDLIPDNGVKIERIISSGQASPPGFWYDQDRDEWVILLQGSAEISWKNGKSQILSPGDWLLIPSHEKHRIEWTSKNPPCIWLAVHADLIINEELSVNCEQ
jgi:cupin 2 domain-containing protein